MATEAQRPTLASVTDVTGEPDNDQAVRGKAVARRRAALGMSKSALAERAHVDRATLDRIESGQDGVRDTSLAAVERALAELDEEMSPPESSEERGVVRFVVRGVYGAEALVVEGPVDNIAELEASVDRIMRRLRSGDEHT